VTTRTKVILGVVGGIVVLAAIGSAMGSPTASPGATQPPGATSPVAVATPSAPASSVAATEAPAAFATIKLSGRGDKVAKFTIPAAVAAIASFTNSGSSNFTVESLSADGSTNDLLVNVIGSYRGTVLFDATAGQRTVAFKIGSNGAWTATIRPTSAARAWDGASKASGKGDDVLLVNPPVSGLATATVTHSGSANFVVESYTADVSDLLVNEIGKYTGEVQLPDGTMLIAISADGAWRITPS
jgi:hypothetical protein